MPKVKSGKAPIRRFRVTRNGKVLYQKQGRRHINSGMTGKDKRQIRRAGRLNDVLARKIINTIKYIGLHS